MCSIFVLFGFEKREWINIEIIYIGYRHIKDLYQLVTDQFFNFTFYFFVIFSNSFRFRNFVISFNCDFHCEQSIWLLCWMNSVHIPSELFYCTDWVRKNVVIMENTWKWVRSARILWNSQKKQDVSSLNSVKLYDSINLICQLFIRASHQDFKYDKESIYFVEFGSYSNYRLIHLYFCNFFLNRERIYNKNFQLDIFCDVHTIQWVCR